MGQDCVDANSQPTSWVQISVLTEVYEHFQGQFHIEHIALPYSDRILSSWERQHQANQSKLVTATPTPLATCLSNAFKENTA